MAQISLAKARHALNMASGADMALPRAWGSILVTKHVRETRAFELIGIPVLRLPWTSRDGRHRVRATLDLPVFQDWVRLSWCEGAAGPTVETARDALARLAEQIEDELRQLRARLNELRDEHGEFLL